MASPLGRKPRKLIWMSGFFFRLKKMAAPAPQNWPMTVATAAPVVPDNASPQKPKMKMGSSTMLTTAPMSWLVMLRLVRPVAASSFSPMVCKNRPRLNTLHTRRYRMPCRAMSGSLVWA